jgi:hypothetical protein
MARADSIRHAGDKPLILDVGSLCEQQIAERTGGLEDAPVAVAERSDNARYL